MCAIREPQVAVDLWILKAFLSYWWSRWVYIWQSCLEWACVSCLFLSDCKKWFLDCQLQLVLFKSPVFCFVCIYLHTRDYCLHNKTTSNLSPCMADSTHISLWYFYCAILRSSSAFFLKKFWLDNVCCFWRK